MPPELARQLRDIPVKKSPEEKLVRNFSVWSFNKVNGKSGAVPVTTSFK